MTKEKQRKRAVIFPFAQRKQVAVGGGGGRKNNLTLVSD